jgi:hypothetical protein
MRDLSIVAGDHPPFDASRGTAANRDEPFGDDGASALIFAEN